MRLTILTLSIIFLAAWGQTETSVPQCGPDSFLNSLGVCECLEAGKFAEPIQLNTLEEALRSLSTNFAAITAQIPSIYNFQEGDTLGYYYIQDGGNDMFDGGNILSISPAYSPVLIYTNGSINNLPINFGEGGEVIIVEGEESIIEIEEPMEPTAEWPITTEETTIVASEEAAVIVAVEEAIMVAEEALVSVAEDDIFDQNFGAHIVDHEDSVENSVTLDQPMRPARLLFGTDFVEHNYFTAKYPGLFVFVADIDIDEFTISGELGADGAGQVEGTVLSQTINGVTYKGFVKRVFGTDDPTVNHLIIVEDNVSVNHYYSADSNEDLHVITGLRGVSRMYYLLFATQEEGSVSNVRVDDATFGTIMNTFIMTLNPTGFRTECTGTCPEGCLTCLSETECMSCNAPLMLVNGECMYTPCDLGSSLNSQGQCECTVPGTFLELIGDQTPQLDETMNAINRNFKDITDQIPYIYHFTEGQNGNSITDGSYDMYDNGNYLTTDLGQAAQTYVYYSDQTIQEDMMLGLNGAYYTAKYPGLFVFVADVNINRFAISGDLGADGSGQVEGTILTQTVNGVVYKGFVKRVFGTSDPSVNHLVIVADNGFANQTYSTDTNGDGHVITNLKGVNRIYYLLFGSYDGFMGAKVEDSSMEAIMSSFITAITSVKRCTATCSEGCLSCISATECTQCDATSTLVDGMCQYALCEPGSFLNIQGECQCNVRGKFLEATSDKTLDQALNAINQNYNLITATIPYVYNFTEGESGNSISDGSNDMYDGGNVLATNLASTDNIYLSYSNSTIQQNVMLGTAGSYFTAKYPGLFVFVADIDTVSDFYITGDLGADNYGSVDGTVLTKNFKGVDYKGFVKRTYGTSDPTVNHLIIVRDNGVVNHTFNDQTNDDRHEINSLQGVNRLYYLLFASYDNSPTTELTDVTMESVMSSFLAIVSGERQCTGNCPTGCMTCSSQTQCLSCDVAWSLVDGTCSMNQ